MSTNESKSEPFLSIIIPAYNEERRLPGTLTRIANYLAQQTYQAEVLIVENGSVDCTADVVERFIVQHPNFYLLSSAQRGKGAAVRLGMLQAQGKYCFICDADLSMPIEELRKFLPPELGSVDIAIGSREAPGARRYNEPAIRHVMGRFFALVERLAGLSVYQDTQCGFKLFRREIVPTLFNLQTLSGWGFDAELLYIAGKCGYRVAEVPINWYYNGDSRVRPLHDSLEMLRDVLRVRWNDLRGRYEIHSHANSLSRALHANLDPHASLQSFATSGPSRASDHAGDLME